MIEAAMEEFVAQLRHYIDALAGDFGAGDLVAARKSGLVPRSGLVSGVPFLFHGKGLRFELGDRLIDVDFCEAGMEVDWWRFKQFLAPLDERSLVERWRDSYASGCAAANARATTIGGRLLVWKS